MVVNVLRLSLVQLIEIELEMYILGVNHVFCFHLYFLSLTRHIIIIVYTWQSFIFAGNFFVKNILLSNLVLPKLVHIILLFESNLVLDSATAQEPEATRVVFNGRLEHLEAHAQDKKSDKLYAYGYDQDQYAILH